MTATRRSTFVQRELWCDG